MTTTINPANRVRKSLSDQLDRLDQILDGLADGLNQAVATAVEGAVKAALVEVITITELHQCLQPALRAQDYRTSDAETEGARPTWARCLVNGVKRALGGVAQMANQAWAWVSRTVVQVANGGWNRLRQTCSWLASGISAIWHKLMAIIARARPLRTPLLVGLGVGTGVGLASLATGTGLAPLVSGLVGLAGSVAAGLVGALRWTLGAMEPGPA
jgi:hypothetical protein